jgi:cytoskeletal protein CcmA (bactofilin family)
MAKAGVPTNCVIGEGSVFEGKFFVNGSILIEGKFQGTIRTEQELIVGPTGKVKTNIMAKSVTIAGTLIGNVTATEEVNLVQSGKVLGDIHAPRINIEEGVVSQGKVTITSNKANPNVTKLIEEDFGNDAGDIFNGLDKRPKGRVREREEEEGQQKKKEAKSTAG